MLLKETISDTQTQFYVDSIEGHFKVSSGELSSKRRLLNQEQCIVAEQLLSSLTGRRKKLLRNLVYVSTLRYCFPTS